MKKPNFREYWPVRHLTEARRALEERQLLGKKDPASAGLLRRAVRKAAFGILPFIAAGGAAVAIPAIVEYQQKESTREEYIPFIYAELVDAAKKLAKSIEQRIHKDQKTTENLLKTLTLGENYENIDKIQTKFKELQKALEEYGRFMERLMQLIQEKPDQNTHVTAFYTAAKNAIMNVPDGWWLQKDAIEKTVLPAFWQALNAPEGIELTDNEPLKRAIYYLFLLCLELDESETAETKLPTKLIVQATIGYSKRNEIIEKDGKKERVKRARDETTGETQSD